MFKVKKKRTRSRSEICSKLTIKTPKRHQFCCSGVFIVNFEIILHLALIFLWQLWTSECRLASVIFTSIYTETVTQRTFSRKVFYIWPVCRGTSMQKCKFNSTEITLLYGYSSVNMQHVLSRIPFLENTSDELLLNTVFNKEVINAEVLHKQAKYQARKTPRLTLNLTFSRSEVAIAVDKTRKRSGVYVRLWLLNCNLCAWLHTFFVGQ